MWSVVQSALNEPPPPAVVVTVGSHVHPVSCPLRSTTIVLPASDAGTEPVNRRPCRSRADATLLTVMPLPLALTLTFPGCTPFASACWAGLLPAGMPAPPDVASASDGATPLMRSATAADDLLAR